MGVDSFYRKVISIKNRETLLHSVILHVQYKPCFGLKYPHHGKQSTTLADGLLEFVPANGVDLTFGGVEA